MPSNKVVTSIYFSAVRIFAIAERRLLLQARSDCNNNESNICMMLHMKKTLHSQKANTPA
jgi:hypothetical protein